MKKIMISVIAIVAMMVAGLSFATNAGATGTEPDCSQPTITVVVQEAYDEVIPAVPAVPAGPDLWWNWSPNNSQGPQNYVPNFPVDARGTWQGPHENGGPMQGTYGTFQTGGGNSPFFHREHGTPGIPGVPEQVIHHPAVTEEIPNPDYPCETETPTETPTVPTETPTVPTETPSVPTETPSVPTETPTEPTETPTVPTENPTEPVETPSVPTEIPEVPEVPTQTPDEPGAPVVETRTRHKYTCTSHVAIHEEKQGGRWVVVSRDKNIFANTCNSDGTSSVQEEGM